MTLWPFGSIPSFQSIESEAPAGIPGQRHSVRHPRVMAQSAETPSRYRCGLCHDRFPLEEVMDSRRTYTRCPVDLVRGLTTYWKLCVNCEVRVREEEWPWMTQEEKDTAGPDYTQRWKVEQDMGSLWSMPSDSNLNAAPAMEHPCVDCGRVTGCFCYWCWAQEWMPSERRVEGPKIPFCPVCDRGYRRCHFCRGQRWCTPVGWSCSEAEGARTLLSILSLCLPVNRTSESSGCGL